MLPLINGPTIKFMPSSAVKAGMCVFVYSAFTLMPSFFFSINFPVRCPSLCRTHTCTHTKPDTDRRASVVVLDWNCQRCHIKCAIIKSRLNFIASQGRKLAGQPLKLRIHRAMCFSRPHFSPFYFLFLAVSPSPFHLSPVQEPDLHSVALVKMDGVSVTEDKRGEECWERVMGSLRVTAPPHGFLSRA